MDGAFAPYLAGMELVMQVLFLVCLRHAWRAGAPAVTTLIAGVLFGVLLEWATIQQLQAYSYGRFPVMLGEVPLCIGVGWGTIIYAARLFSNATTLPPWARPVLDGLLALNVDMAMDAVAIRVGMWDWGRGPSFEYFGVPWANFWAWFWVVFFFSGGVRLLSWKGSALRRTLAPFGAVLIGVAGVLGTNLLIVRGIPGEAREVAVGGVLLSALVFVLALRPRLVAPLDALASIVPLLLHLYFLGAGILSGVFAQVPFIGAVSVTMLVLALALHRHSLALLPRPAALAMGAQRSGVRPA